MHNDRLVGLWTTLGYLPTQKCVLATGGLGALYHGSTAPTGLRGNALGAAARAGARLIDMEFTQFHPTALALRASPGQETTQRPGRRLLISEAVRGAGAWLIDEKGERFTEELPFARHRRPRYRRTSASRA